MKKRIKRQPNSGFEDPLKETVFFTPRFAETGLEDNIAAFSSDYPEEKIEKEVRFAFGIDPYPETYPLYD